MQDKIDWVKDQDENILTADGFDYALIGVCERFGQTPIATYDLSKCIAILVERDGMTEEEAYDYFYFNVIGAWVGEYTPCFVKLYTSEEK